MASMKNLFDEAPAFKLPLAKGGDLYVKFVYKPLVVDGSGDAVLDGNGKKQYEVDDYPENCSVKLVIDYDDEEIEFPATIDGSVATVHGDYLLTNPIKTGSLWRAIVTYDGGLDVVMVNGIVVRADGK